LIFVTNSSVKRTGSWGRGAHNIAELLVLSFGLSGFTTNADRLISKTLSQESYPHFLYLK